MLLRNPDGAVKKNGLVPLPTDRLQEVCERLLRSHVERDDHRQAVQCAVEVLLPLKQAGAGKIRENGSCTVVLSPFTPVGAFHISFCFIWEE